MLHSTTSFLPLLSVDQYVMILAYAQMVHNLTKVE